MKSSAHYFSLKGEYIPVGILYKLAGRRAKIVKVEIDSGTYRAEFLEPVEAPPGCRWILTDDMIDDAEDEKKDRVDTILTWR